MRNYFVIARNSSFAYKGKAIDVRQVGRELGVKYVIEGSVRKAGNRIRVTAQLIEAASGAHVWAEKYDRPLDDMFDVQDEIVRAVAASTQTEVLLHGDDSPRKPPRPDMTTWELAKKAWMAAYGFSREGHETAIDLAKLAVARDPVNALGYEVLASVQMHVAYMGFAAEPEALAQEALANIRRALELGGASEYSHWVHGTIIGFLFGKHEQACTALRQAIDLNPNFSLAYGTLGTMLVLVGKPDEGIRNTEFAIRLNPRDPGVFFRYSGLSLAYLMKRDLSASLDWAERSASRNPDWWMAHALIAAIHAMQGRAEPARTAMDDLRRVLPSATLSNLPWRSFLSGTEFENVNKALRELGLPE
jgi:adenylate cyclase